MNIWELDIALVTWVDSRASEKSWEKPDTAREFDVADCLTVGYVLDNGKDKLTLAMCIADNAVNGVLSIPKACIKSVDILEVPAY